MLMEMLMKTLALMSSEITWHVARDCTCVRPVGVHASPENAERERHAEAARHGSLCCGFSCGFSLARSREGRRTTRRSDGADASWREKELINHHGYGDYWNLF